MLLPERSNTAAQRIKENEQAKAQFQVASASQVLRLPVEAGTGSYFEEGELAMPAVFSQTAKERSLDSSGDSVSPTTGSERRRLESLGLVKEHTWIKWRSVYFHHPEDNGLELVCYDESLE